MKNDKKTLLLWEITNQTFSGTTKNDSNITMQLNKYMRVFFVYRERNY